MAALGDSLRRYGVDYRRPVVLGNCYGNNLGIGKRVGTGNEPDLVDSSLSKIGIEDEATHTAAGIRETGVYRHLLGQKAYDIAIQVGSCHSEFEMPAIGHTSGTDCCQAKTH